jgi:hypothetical protein
MPAAAAAWPHELAIGCIAVAITSPLVRVEALRGLAASERASNSAQSP